jgi:hypothetical protein
MADEHVESKKVQAVGQHASILQHGVDHLAGVLQGDRMRNMHPPHFENLERSGKPTSENLAKLTSGLGSRGFRGESRECGCSA